MNRDRPDWPTRHLFDVRIDAIGMDQVVAAAADAIATRRRLLIGVVNAAKLVNMSRDERLRRAVVGADLIVADGMAVVWGCRILYRKLPERVTGIDLMTELLKLSNDHGHRVYCLGATEDVLSSVRTRIEQEYPGVVLAGMRNGFFSDDEEEVVAREITAARPDVLFIGMTSPKKERFLSAWAATMSVPVCHGVGGAFDVFAGKVKRAPQIMQNLGMEWLYRVGQEPKRLWKRYLVTNTLFAGMLIGEGFRGVRRFALERRGHRKYGSRRAPAGT